MLTPLSPNQWDRAKAAHLLNRAGFGGPPEEIDSLTQNGLAYAIHRLVDGPATPPPAPAPSWARPRDLRAVREAIKAAVLAVPTDDPVMRRQLQQKAAGAERTEQQEHVLDLLEWWLQRMINAPDPLEEKMTLFWHGHFTTSAQKVHDGYLMWRQNQTFRDYARGSFATLAKAMTRDPGMIQWLDLQQSRAQHANENFARELMELFTLGEGNYTESDVTESARAFTGHRVDPSTQEFRFTAKDHDAGAKQFLGHSGNFNGDDVIDIILQQPVCAQLIARKLWTFFAGENASPALIDAVAGDLRANNYEVRPVLHRMFTSEEFYAPEVMHTQIKSPVQWMVQTVRTLSGELPPILQVFGALKTMGQVPFMPPNVKGWDGGKAWISTSTLLFRYNFAEAMLQAPGLPGVDRGGGGLLKGDKKGALDKILMTAMNGPAEAPPLAAGSPFGAGLDGTAVIPLPHSAVAPRPTMHNRVDPQKLAPDALRADPAATLRTLTVRLFQEPLPPKETEALRDYLKTAGPHITDKTVLALVHLMMSTPAYQLC